MIENNDFKIKQVLLGYICEYEVANTTQLCRAVNRQFRCYSSDYSYRKAGAKIVTACSRCKFKYPYIQKLLRRLEKQGKVKSKKMRFWDNPPFNNKRTDLFRFWFIEKQEFEQRILRQTLIPYIKTEKVKS